MKWVSHLVLTHIYHRRCKYKYIYIYIYSIHILTYELYVHLYIYTYIHVYIYSSIHIYIYTCVHVYMYWHIYPPTPPTARGSTSEKIYIYTKKNRYIDRSKVDINKIEIMFDRWQVTFLLVSHLGAGFIGTFSWGWNFFGTRAEVSEWNHFFYILQPCSSQVFIRGTNDNNGHGFLALDFANVMLRCVHLDFSILLADTAILFKIFEYWVAKGETQSYASKFWREESVSKRHKSMCGRRHSQFFCRLQGKHIKVQIAVGNFGMCQMFQMKHCWLPRWKKNLATAACLFGHFFLEDSDTTSK